MPRGYPDYFGQSIFPKYGTITIDDQVVNCPQGVVTTIHNIEGKGRIYGGAFATGAGTPDTTDELQIIIDGITLFNITMYDFWDIFSPVEDHLPMRFLYYDTGSPKFRLAYIKDFTYEKSFVIKYKSKAVGGVFIISRYIYANIV